MSFLYPLGLLGLIGVPILILVYIIKSKYTEQTVASTYLWTLSERFLKRKRRPSPLAGLISLIIQILAVIVASLAIAHPSITVPNAANEYCFILDGSGSMNMTVGDAKEPMTRFEAGKEAIRERIDRAVDGSIFTLIYAGDTTGVIFERVVDKEQAYILLDELEPSCNTLPLADAIGLAQGYFNENPSVITCLVTDTAFETVENVEVVNVGDAAENYSLSEISHTRLGDEITVTGKVISHTSDATLTLELCVVGEETPRTTQAVSVKGGEPTVFVMTAAVDSYASVTVRIKETDALALDNLHTIYNISSENSYNTLLISERPFFLEAVLKSQLGAKIDVMKPEEYDGRVGYGLYVFDTVDPSTMDSLPADGTVWLINVAGSVEGAGYTVQGAVTLNKAELLSKSESSSSVTATLTEDLQGNGIYMTRYIKCGFYRNFTTLLSYKGNPVVFAGTNEYGNREAVVAFDIHDSNLPLLSDFTVLIRNLIRYSFPDMVEDTAFVCGENATVNVIANCESIRVESPSRAVSYLKTDGAFDHIRLTEVGTYTVSMTVSGSPREFYIWSSMIPEESNPSPTAEAVLLQGTSSEGGFDGTFDPLTILFIALAVLFLADWMVYCYEKYQLR